MAETTASRLRRLQVLRAIVEDYVTSREPVGSKALVERHELGVSAATIRNDMAALEDAGLIAAPHTSAGRVPTEAGYRHFVDRIEEVKPLSVSERSAIATLMDGSEDIDEVLSRTVRLLSNLTRQVAVAQVPRLDDARLRHVELVTLGQGQLLVVLISSKGSVLQRIAAVPEDSGDAAVTRVKEAVLRATSGARIAAVPAALADVAEQVEPALRPLASAVADTLIELAQGERNDRVIMAGTANLARSTQDFHGNITPVLEALEEQVVLLRLFSEMQQDAHGIAVSIGSENSLQRLTATSVVAAGYGPNNSAMLGVLGPTRMDYPGSIAAVRAVARYLSRILTN